MNYIKELTKQDFINTYGKLPNDRQYIELFCLLVQDEGIEMSSHYVQRDNISVKEFTMELKDYWSYEYDDYEGDQIEYNFSVAGSFEECILSAINMIDAEFGNDHDYMSVYDNVRKILDE